MNLKTTAALLITAATLSACTDIEINKALAALTGDLDQLTDEHAQLKAELAAPQSADNPATEADLNDLRQKYAELALRLESVGYTPEPLPSAEPAEPEPPAGPPKYNEFGYTGPEPCPGSMFRILTCDDNGTDWHWLGPTMEWMT